MSASDDAGCCASTNNTPRADVLPPTHILRLKLTARSTKTKSSHGLQGELPASDDPDPTCLRFFCIYTTRGFASKIQAHVRERSACMLCL